MSDKATDLRKMAIDYRSEALRLRKTADDAEKNRNDFSARDLRSLADNYDSMATDADQRAGEIEETLHPVEW